jgi:hypothetical protein
MAMSMIATSFNKVSAPAENGRRAAMLAPSITLPALPSRAEPIPRPGLNAFIQLSGAQFIITNMDSYDWRNVKMEVSGGSPSGGHTLYRPMFRAGEVYTVEPIQFLDPAGNRFNLYQTRPRRFSICADTPNGYTCFVGRLDH